MGDDNQSGSPAGPQKPLETRPRYQRIDHARSRQRADNALTSRQPSDVDDIKARLKAALKEKVAMKSLAEVFPPKASTPPPQEPLKVSPLPETPKPQPSPIQAVADDAPATPIMSENGFQIFKPAKPEADNASDRSDDNTLNAALNENLDDIVNKSVDPVPMKPDAIEEALQMINDEDNDHADKKDNDADIGFIPVNIAPGIFGSDEIPSSTSKEDEELSGPIDDDQLISELLNEDSPILSSKPPAETPAVESPAPDEPKAPSLQLVENAEAGEKQETVPAKDKIQHWQIGQAIASSIRNIVKDEVDLALDRMAREAVREAIRAHRQ